MFRRLSLSRWRFAGGNNKEDVVAITTLPPTILAIKFRMAHRNRAASLLTRFSPRFVVCVPRHRWLAWSWWKLPLVGIPAIRRRSEDWVRLVDAAHLPASSDFPLPETAVILAAQIDTPEVNSDISKLARLLYEANDFGWVEVAFVGNNSKSSLSTMVQRVKQLGARRLVIAPWVLFAGTVVTQIKESEKVSQCAGRAMATNGGLI